MNHITGRAMIASGIAVLVGTIVLALNIEHHLFLALAGATLSSVGFLGPVVYAFYKDFIENPKPTL